MISVSVGSASDVGKLRQVNQDSAGAGPGVFVVADGMGGHAAGEIASELAVARLSRLGHRPDVRPDDVRSELALANQDILDCAAENAERLGMGTTVAGLSLVSFAGTQHWAVFNVGDSRVYRFVSGTLVQMTVDHSEVEELVADGTIDAAQARNHSRRNVVTRALGTDPAPEPDVWVFPPTPGERFLICSDGLSIEVADAEIAAVLQAETSPQMAAEALVRKAVAYGGRDNVTVVVVDHLPDQVNEAEMDTLRPAQRAESRR